MLPSVSVSGTELPPPPGPGQKTKNCDADMGEEMINGGCYARLAKKPPCGPRLLEYEGACFRAVAAPVRDPVSAPGR